jgi:hypothetical protein
MDYKLTKLLRITFEVHKLIKSDSEPLSSKYFNNLYEYYRTEYSARERS